MRDEWKNKWLIELRCESHVVGDLLRAIEPEFFRKCTSWMRGDMQIFNDLSNNRMVLVVNDEMTTHEGGLNDEH